MGGHQEAFVQGLGSGQRMKIMSNTVKIILRHIGKQVFGDTTYVKCDEEVRVDHVQTRGPEAEFKSYEVKHSGKLMDWTPHFMDEQPECAVQIETWITAHLDQAKRELNKLYNDLPKEQVGGNDISCHKGSPRKRIVWEASMDGQLDGIIVEFIAYAPYSGHDPDPEPAYRVEEIQGAVYVECEGYKISTQCVIPEALAQALCADHTVRTLAMKKAP
jgi:hypothetical protein